MSDNKKYPRANVNTFHQRSDSSGNVLLIARRTSSSFFKLGDKEFKIVADNDSAQLQALGDAFKKQK